MRILFVGPRWDYKDPARGSSFEFTNLWDSLHRMEGITAELFAFDEIERAVGRRTMNERLLAQVGSDPPELVFFFLFEQEFSIQTLDALRATTTTFNWFADDHWRFETFSKRLAPHFSLASTTDEASLERYRAAGMSHVILTQWACNHHTYKPAGVERDLDVTFVGQAHGNRRQMISRLRAEGIAVEAWGSGWPNGRLSQEEMVLTFSRSKVNLSLANPSTPEGVADFVKQTLKPRGRPLPSLRAVRDNVIELRSKKRDQIKGRNFEIPGCKALLLSSDIPGLERYFKIGSEIDVFSSFEELVAKCRRYVDRDDDRERIAEAGHRRTLENHTYELRFSEILDRVRELRR